jgi:uncharacterized protein YraI
MERNMRNILMATAGVLMMSGAAMAQTTTTAQTPTTPSVGSGYSTNGPSISSNGAAVAPNGGLQSGVGTTLVNPATGDNGKVPVGNNSGSK